MYGNKISYKFSSFQSRNEKKFIYSHLLQYYAGMVTFVHM